MKCPVDGTALLITERSGVEIDYCPQCRGVWLDRGELDKIIDRAADLAGGALATTTGLPGDPLSEAITALQALGYKPAEADRMARKVAAEGDVAEAIIRKALQSALR